MLMRLNNNFANAGRIPLRAKRDGLAAVKAYLKEEGQEGHAREVVVLAQLDVVVGEVQRPVRVGEGLQGRGARGG